MTALEYEVVDVFTDRPFTGNPLAVVLDADDLDTRALQAIANEFQLSETAFPMKTARRADYRLRIFTPQQELPFAGHPSIGAAWVLARRGRVPPGTVLQSCGAGVMTLEVTAEGGPVTLGGGAPTYGSPREATGLLVGLGLRQPDLAGVPRDASCGLGFTYLPVVADALARIEVDLPALRRLGLGDAAFGGLSVVAWDGRSARCRVFAYEAGVTEDPATGSAALGLGVYLVASRLVAADGPTAYTVVQGVEMGRPSRLDCVVTAARGEAVSTSVSGAVVPVASGTIRRP